MHCSFNLNNDLRRWVLPLFPFCRWGSGGSGLSSEAPVSCNCGCRFKPESGSWMYIHYATQPPGHSTCSAPLEESPFSLSLWHQPQREACVRRAHQIIEKWDSFVRLIVEMNDEPLRVSLCFFFFFDERHQLLVCLPWDCFKSSWIKSAFILTI